jgi:hypothetical protein
VLRRRQSRPPPGTLSARCCSLKAGEQPEGRLPQQASRDAPEVAGRYYQATCRRPPIVWGRAAIPRCPSLPSVSAANEGSRFLPASKLGSPPPRMVTPLSESVANSLGPAVALLDLSELFVDRKLAEHPVLLGGPRHSPHVETLAQCRPRMKDKIPEHHQPLVADAQPNLVLPGELQPVADRLGNTKLGGSSSGRSPQLRSLSTSALRIQRLPAKVRLPRRTVPPVKHSEGTRSRKSISCRGLSKTSIQGS